MENKNKQPRQPTGKSTSLRKVVGYYKGKDRFMVREVQSAQDILRQTRRTKEYKQTVLTCVVLACIGAVIGLIIQNVLTIPILALGMFMIPIWRLKLYHGKYQKYTRMQLESAVSLITASYMRNNDIYSAVSENVQNISSFIRPYFEEFLAEYKVNPSMKICLRNLQGKINDAVFREWCDCLVKSYENSEVKENLARVVEKYSTVRIVQDELDAEMATSLVEYVIMLVALASVYPLIRMLNVTWFESFSTLPGKICVAYSLFVGVFSIKKLLDVTTPIQFDR